MIITVIITDHNDHGNHLMIDHLNAFFVENIHEDEDDDDDDHDDHDDQCHPMSTSTPPLLTTYIQSSMSRPAFSSCRLLTLTLIMIIIMMMMIIMMMRRRRMMMRDYDDLDIDHDDQVDHDYDEF